jgi:hypothetical protein
MREMNNQHRRRNFTPSDDELIQQQPITGVGLKILESLLRTNREALIAGLTSSTFRCSSAMVMIMTERSTRECSAAPRDSSTRYWNGSASTRRAEVIGCSDVGVSRSPASYK